MPLSGLPSNGGSLVLLATTISVPVTTLGLVLLRASQPREQEDDGATVKRRVLLRAIGAAAGLLHFAGLALAAAPYAIGAESDTEAKACALLRALVCPCCWAAERWLLQDEDLPPLQGVLCFAVWFAGSLAVWVGPQPQDSVSGGLPAQIAGCDGGYRTPFLMYVPMWFTGLLTGLLLLLLEEVGDSSVWPLNVVTRPCKMEVQGVEAPSSPQRLRRKLLPLVYAAAVSMAYYALAAGVAAGSSRCVVAAALLLALATLCAWDWTWRIGLTLGSWAPASQLCTTLAFLFQDHFLFRDLRWDPVLEIGPLVVWEGFGIPLFCIGCTVLWVIFILFVRADDTQEWGAGDATLADLLRFSSGDAFDYVDTGGERGGAVAATATKLAWLLLPLCAVTFLLGVTLPITRGELHMPQAEWQRKSGHNSTQLGSGGYTETTERSYVQMIGYLYDHRLPLSALSIVWTSVVTPTMQFGETLIALGRPRCVPMYLQEAFRRDVIFYAPYRFASPIVCMLLTSMYNFAEPEGDYINLELMPGFYFFVAYSVLALLLATALDIADWFKAHARVTYDLLKNEQERDDEPILGLDEPMDVGPLRRLQTRFATKAANEYAKGHWRTALAIFVLGAIATYVALTRPFFIFEFRVSGLNMKVVQPTMLELLLILQEKSWTMGAMAAATLVAAGLAWVPLVLLLLLRKQSNAPPSLCLRAMECIARPWAMSHVWAGAVCFIFCVYKARNKEIFEVCLSFPSVPIGLVAIVAMGCATFGMQLLLCELCPKPSSVTVFPVIPQLPGGLVRWGAGLGSFGLVWFLLFCETGPMAPPVVTDLQDVNHRLQIMLPLVNGALGKRLPNSMGDCEALRKHLAQQAWLQSAPRPADFSCRGHAPLATKKTNGMETTAVWTTGMDTFTITSVRVLQPTINDGQRWSLDIDGKFDQIRLWLRVMLGQRMWINDYMCCDGPFRFTIQASATCREVDGFQKVHLEFSHLDKIKFSHKVDQITKNPGEHRWYQVDYGEARQVQEALEDFLRGGAGRLVVKTPDGQGEDFLQLLGDLLGEVLYLNTGHRCPQHF
eukprot:TRINITY_DN71933_c0_g1_i1.p1 TRINITY_DN71933_c0_g1~~TRINITY_DN71933_c0_g1_i1.p1  ORF type:complete len:1063 (+),score=225.23 TRINITY_DN71933_c0_g1_i1:188-3376(+)